MDTFSWASLVAQVVKNPAAMWETCVRSLSWEDHLEEGMATHSSIPAWRTPVDREAWQAPVPGVTESRTKQSAPFILLVTESKRPGFCANVFKIGKHKEHRTE